MATARRDSDVSTEDDDASDQEEGALEGGQVQTPETGTGDGANETALVAAVGGPTTSTAVAPTLSLTPFLSSSRDGREGGGRDRNSPGRRQSPDRKQQELEDAYRRIAQQDDMLDRLERRLRESEERERLREVREGHDGQHGLVDRYRTRIRATDQSEVSGRFFHPGQGQPETSTPLRQVGFDLEGGPGPADLSVRPAMSTSVSDSGGRRQGETLRDRTEATANLCPNDAAPDGRMVAHATMCSTGAGVDGRRGAHATTAPGGVDPSAGTQLGGDGVGLTSQPSRFPSLEEGRLAQVAATPFPTSTFSRQGEEVG